MKEPLPRHPRPERVRRLVLCSDEFAAGIRGSQLAWFEHSGHFPFIEEPEAFWSRVGGFLQAA